MRLRDEHGDDAYVFQGVRRLRLARFEAKEALARLLLRLLRSWLLAQSRSQKSRGLRKVQEIFVWCEFIEVSRGRREGVAQRRSNWI